MGESNVVYTGVRETPFDTEQAESEVWTETAGAVVVFSGVVRNHDAGRRVERLSYSAHPSAQDILGDVAQECSSAHAEVRIWVAHRIGDLEIGDTALVAACASAHRAAAFAACQDLVEGVKQKVPIWKQQHYEDGTHAWLGLP